MASQTFENLTFVRTPSNVYILRLSFTHRTWRKCYWMPTYSLNFLTCCSLATNTCDVSFFLLLFLRDFNPRNMTISWSNSVNFFSNPLEICSRQEYRCLEINRNNLKGLKLLAGIYRETLLDNLLFKDFDEKPSIRSLSFIF